MGRRKKGDLVSGWVIVDKPVGPTSTQVVGAVRRAFNAQKAGHAGTLDPLAEGILPIALGEATKTIPYVVDGEKVYRFTVKWGEATSTDDAEGEVVATSPIRPDETAIKAALEGFLGDISQVPPQFSAIKVAGERAYDLARDGETVELKARTVTIYEAELLGTSGSETAEFEIVCSKGTYVRAIARDLAEALNTRGHVVGLRRLATGPFDENRSISLDKLKEFGNSAPARDALWANLLPLETALDDIPVVAVSTGDATRLKQGQAILLRGRDAPVIEGLALTVADGTPVALAEYDRGELKPVRVFNVSG
jgi:tRNA pseudouridine55 synthase